MHFYISSILFGKSMKLYNFSNGNEEIDLVNFQYNKILSSLL